MEKAHARLQRAMDEGDQASLGQAIDESKGVNGLKQLRRSAKARLKQLSADQNRDMLGSTYKSEEEPLSWRVSNQGGRHRAVAHLPTSIIGWVIGHKGCNARMLKQQTGTELWVDVPGQCVIIEAKSLEEVESAMDAVNAFVKTAPTFIAKIQAGGGNGVTHTVQCPVQLLPQIQRQSRKIQAESGAHCVFANCKMSTFCVTGDRKHVDRAVAMLKMLITEGVDAAAARAAQSPHLGRVGVEGLGVSAGNEMGGGLQQGRARSDHSFGGSEDSPATTAPCSPDATPSNSAWCNGVPTHMRSWGSPASNPPPAMCPQQHQQFLQQQHQHLRGFGLTQGSDPLLSQLGQGQGHPQGGYGHEIIGAIHPPASVVGGGRVPPTLPEAPAAPFHGGGSGIGVESGGASGVGGGLDDHSQDSHRPSFSNTMGISSSSGLSLFSYHGGEPMVAPHSSGPVPTSNPVVAVSSQHGTGGLQGSATLLPGLNFFENAAGREVGLFSGAGNGEAHGYDQYGRKPPSWEDGGQSEGTTMDASKAAAGGGGGGMFNDGMMNARFDEGNTGGVFDMVEEEDGERQGEGTIGLGIEDDLSSLLAELGLLKYLSVFRASEVDLATLRIMSEADFDDLGILKGPRVKIMHHIGSR